MILVKLSFGLTNFFILQESHNICVCIDCQDKDVEYLILEDQARNYRQIEFGYLFPLRLFGRWMSRMRWCGYG